MRWSFSSCRSQFVVQRQQIAHVFQRVVDLRVGERPAAPIGPLFALGRRAIEKLADHAAVGRRIFRAAEAGGKLRVEQVGGRAVAVVSAKFTSSRAAWTIVVCRPSASVCQNSLSLPDSIRIDHRQPILGGHLDQAQFGAERVFRDKLGVEADAVGAGKLLAKASELGRRGDGCVRHGGVGNRPAKRFAFVR